MQEIGSPVPNTISSPFCMAIVLLRIYPNDKCSLEIYSVEVTRAVQNDLHTKMFTVALFVTGKKENHVDYE